MAAPMSKEEVKSSNEILDEIFKVLKDKSESRELELNGKDLTKIIFKDKRVDVGDNVNDSDSQSNSDDETSSKKGKKRKKSKSSKHHKKHKKHHHKHKRRKKSSETGHVSYSSVEEDDDDSVKRRESSLKDYLAGSKDDVVESALSPNKLLKQQIEGRSEVSSNAALTIDAEKLVSLGVETIDEIGEDGSAVKKRNEMRNVDSNKARKPSAAGEVGGNENHQKDILSKRPVEEQGNGNDEDRDQVALKKKKNMEMENTGSRSPSQLDPTAYKPSCATDASNEQEEGEISDEGNSEKSGASSVSSTAKSPSSPRKSKDEETGGRKKHKKSKHKKKKKKKSKEIKRFTAPLAVTLTSRSRRLSLASRRSTSPHSRPRSRSKSRSLSRDHSPKSRGFRRRRRSRSSSAEKRRSLRAGTPINKPRLLEIARKNAMLMMAQGRIPAGLPLPPLEKGEVVAIKSGGKSLAELNDFCKLLSKKESEGGDGSGDEDKSLFIHHPFKPREHQPNIVMNIRNSVQIPVKTSAEKVAEGSKLRIQFPVSSGTQHRKKEGEWVPVSPDKEEISKSSSLAVVALPSTPTSTPGATSQAVFKKPAAVAKEPLALMPSLPPKPDSVFPVPTMSLQKLDIGSIVSQRLKAVRKLKDNPHDIEALCQMYKSQQEMSSWAESKQLPGQFTGSTDATILTPQQLAGPAHTQAWVKKDQFSRVAPVKSGVGMQMLQKMGWKPGEGLGKNSEGQAEPIILDIKLDKKGLVSHDELPRNFKRPNMPAPKDLSGKHPVSALVELCNKRRWGGPEFSMVFDSGPDHKKNFVFKVKVNGVEYQPTIASLNKKHGKAQCATVCLQALGLLPRDFQNPI